jgi:protein-tyrosine phosphatase
LPSGAGISKVDAMTMHEVWRLPPEAPRREGRRPDVVRIVTGLLIGEYPVAGDIPWLRELHGISTIVNLQDAHDLQALALDLDELRAAAAACAIAYHHFPVPDCGPEQLAPTLGRVLATLAAADGSGRIVYLHCNAGLNRAPTVAIAYLHAHAGLSLVEACALVKSRRACGPYMRVLEQYFRTR